MSQSNSSQQNSKEQAVQNIKSLVVEKQKEELCLRLLKTQQQS